MNRRIRGNRHLDGRPEMEVPEMTATSQDDVVSLLLDQHEQVKSLFSRLKASAGTQKKELFEDLVRLLAVHETAEEEVVHPTARRKLDHGEEVVDGRLHEEEAAKRALAELYDLGVDHPDFDGKLAAFEEAVVRHATREENEEFVRLREMLSPDQLRRMAGAVRAAEATAPTRPHPQGPESAVGNLLVGPPVAIFDRIRDGVRDWRKSHKDE
jgi:hemerythrin superfamily protein